MRAYLQLIRAPNLFTAASNAVAGFTLMTAVDQAQFDRPRWDHLVILMFISAALYASGAVFNDCLDLQHDTRFRPERPIPSGEVPLGRAYLLGVLLVVAALVAAMCLKTTTVLFTGLLITAIWLYNGVLKRFVILGALGMGLCRFLNVMLGMSTGSSLNSFMLPENRVLIWAPLLMGLYAVIVTAASHYEDRPAGGHGPWVLFGAAAGLPVVLSGAAFIVVQTVSGWALLFVLIPATAAIFIMTLMKVTFASVRRAIAASVMLIIVFDAAVVLGTRNEPTWLGLV
ncbi:MAG: UbiA family prenyltransferase, partial [Planctomycetota bacterium]